jgi:ligand-binding sensor domain-containing protein
MRIVRLTLLVSLVASSGSPALAQEVWTTYTVENTGLPHNNVHAVQWDLDGLLWMGTDGGLVTFDGSTWNTYTVDNSVLQTNVVRALALTRDGTIWIGTDDGLASYDGHTWRLYTNENSPLFSNEVSFLVADSHGRLWIGTYHYAITVVSNGGWHTYTPEISGLPRALVRDVKVDAAGVIWMATAKGVVRVEGEEWTIFDADFEAKDDHPQAPLTWAESIAIGDDGDIWVALGWAGIARRTDTTWTHISRESAGFSDHGPIANLFVAPDGSIWAFGGQQVNRASAEIGVFDGANWSLYLANDLVPYYESPYVHATSVTFGADGRPTLGLYSSHQVTGGIAIAENDGWRNHAVQTTGLPYNTIASLAVDDESGLWIGIASTVSGWGGVVRWKDDEWYTVIDPAAGPAADARALLLEEGGVVWIGTRNEGLIRHPPDSDRSVFNKENSSLPSNEINSLLRGRDGTLWVGTSSGLASLRNDTWTVHGNRYYTIVVIEDEAGDIWAGVGTELHRLRNGNWQQVTSYDSSLPGTTILALVKDEQDNLWIGTHNGLARYDGTSFTVFTTLNSPLPNDEVTALLAIHDDLWIGTREGVVRLRGDSWTTYAHAVPEGMTHVTALARTRDRLWIGTSSGLLAVDGLVATTLERGGLTFRPSFTANAFPNPVREEVVFQISLDSPASVRVDLYDVTGRLVRRIPTATKEAGEHQIRISVTDLPSGLHFARVTADGKASVISLLKIR